jgi:hypothetical protein
MMRVCPALVGPELEVISNRPGTRSLPTLVVLDPDLVVRPIEAGFPGDAAVARMVEGAFAELLDENDGWALTCPDIW